MNVMLVIMVISSTRRISLILFFLHIYYIRLVHDLDIPLGSCCASDIVVTGACRSNNPRPSLKAASICKPAIVTLKIWHNTVRTITAQFDAFFCPQDELI